MPNTLIVTSSLELPHSLDFVKQQLQLIVINLDKTVLSVSYYIKVVCR